jgi:hypothetical protein
MRNSRDRSYTQSVTIKWASGLCTDNRASFDPEMSGFAESYSNQLLVDHGRRERFRRIRLCLQVSVFK